MAEFHDLAEQLLNAESGHTTCWGNLGYWANANSYPAACAALADQLALAAGLDHQSRVFDVGFGAGDQLLHWLRQYRVATLAGVNLSRSQTRYAQQRLREAGFDECAERLSLGSVEQLSQSSQSNDVDTLLSLDAAYHFPSRKRFLGAAAAVLPEGGVLAVTDIVLGDREPGWPGRTALKVMAGLSHIPADNLICTADYHRQWQDAGFELNRFEDISAAVFKPFGEWLRRYKSTSTDVRWHQWLKYDVTAAVLRKAADGDALRYVICAGRRISQRPA